MNGLYQHFVQFGHWWTAAAWLILEWLYLLFAYGSQCFVGFLVTRWWVRGGKSRGLTTGG